jgi:hypothetical protein
VILAAAGLGSDEAGHRGLLLLTHVKKKDIVEHGFAPLAPARAREYLGRLIHDLLTGSPDSAGEPSGLHAYLFPCEAVFLGRLKHMPLLDAIAHLRDKHEKAERGDHGGAPRGPIRDAFRRWNPPAPAEVDRMAEDRFGLLFELLEAEAE